MTQPRLWSWMLSPFSGKVRVVAAETGVEFELLEIDPRSRPARLRELNPTNTVPVLEVDGVAVRESTAICEWLDERYPAPPIWPEDPEQRAAARGLTRWVDDELTVNFFLSMRKEGFGLDDRVDHPNVVSNLRRNLGRRWAVLEALLERSDSPWLMGTAEPTMPDLAGMAIAVRLPQWKAELQPPAQEHPRATAWLAALRGRPSAAAIEQAGEPAS